MSVNTHNLMTMFIQASPQNAETVGIIKDIKIIFITIHLYDSIFYYTGHSMMEHVLKSLLFTQVKMT